MKKQALPLIAEIQNISEIPAEILTEIKMCNNLSCSGFQEILGYQGRELICSLGGHWTHDPELKFIVANYGSRTIQWDGKRIFKSKPLSLKFFGKTEEESIKSLKVIQNALSKCSFINGKYMGFVSARDIKKGCARFPLPNSFPQEIPKVHAIIAAALDGEGVVGTLEFEEG